MKIIRLLASCLLMACMTLVLAGCKPHEERVLDQLDRFSERIQKNDEKWEFNEGRDAILELTDILCDMKDCEFTPEQQRDLNRLKGEITVIIMTKVAKNLGDELLPFLEGEGSFMNEYKGSTEIIRDYTEGGFEKHETRITQAIESINKQLDLDGNKIIE